MRNKFRVFSSLEIPPPPPFPQEPEVKVVNPWNMLQLDVSAQIQSQLKRVTDWRIENERTLVSPCCYGYVGLKMAKNGFYHIQMGSFITRVHNLIVYTQLLWYVRLKQVENKFESHLTFLFRVREKTCASNSTESMLIFRVVPKSFVRKSNLPHFLNISPSIFPLFFNQLSLSRSLSPLVDSFFFFLSS